MAELPKDIHVGALLNGRVKELAELSRVVKYDVRHGKLASQQVPRHMRRRAVSHDVRRLPRRLRGKYLKEKDQGGGNVPAGKRPSRKFRRRASNLLQEYNRRQMKHFWMETHIWHAKRFHMCEKWGYKIPEFPNDKCWRACYRATKSSALMFDISYNHLMEITGNIQHLLTGLNTLTRAETGLKFELPPGGRERVALLFDPMDKVLGEVKYLWLPHQAESSEQEEDLGRLWIFCHPSYVAPVMKAIKSALKFPPEPTVETKKAENASTASEETTTKPDDASEMDTSEPPAKKIKTDNKVNLAKLEARNVPADRAPRYSGPNGVEISDFQGTVNRFRLVGPKSLDIIKKVCIPAKLDAEAATESDESGLMWWRDFFNEQEKLSAIEQNERLEKATGILAENLAITVGDPRLLLPVQKCGPPKADADLKTNEAYDISAEAPTGATSWDRSPFFNSYIRDKVSLSKRPDAEINEFRSKSLIPGTRLNLGDRESRIPIVILPIDSGFDLLIPAGWGMSFWLCLVFNGCRVGALREMNHLSLEQGEFPVLCKYPESSTCQHEAFLQREKLKDQHFAMPPNKRVNFTKLGIACPFYAPLDVLANDWRSDESLRSADQTERPNDQVISMNNLKVVRNVDTLDRIRTGDFSSAQELSGHLVAVRVNVEGKGRLTENTLICLPTEEDLQEDIGFWEGPVDSLQADSNEKERKETRENHQKTKKRLKRQWKKLKDKQVLMKTQSSALGKPLDTEKLNLISNNMSILKKMRNHENAEYSASAEHLWLGDFNTVRHSCRREVIGYVTAGNMSYRTGGFVGFGFVAFRGLQKLHELTKEKRLLVLTRETTSLQYRFSSLQIL